MNKTGLILVGGITIVAVIFLGKFLTADKKPIAENVAQTETVANTTSTVENQETQTTLVDEASWYTDYSDAALAEATAEDGRAVIFFHASWCPSCQAASMDFEANQNQIPLDVTILKADYDTATELKEKYNIVMQDTFVQVDATGKELTKWNSGGEGIKSLLANLKDD